MCKRYSFDIDNDVKTLRFENKSMEDIVEMVLYNSWNIDDQFHFFTQPGVMNLTFPCTTTLGKKKKLQEDVIRPESVLILLLYGKARQRFSFF